MKIDMTRRSFLKKTSLVIAATAVADSTELANLSHAARAASPNFTPHAFVEIAPDDTITIWVGQTNLGQGTHTGLAMVITDELDGAWDKVEVKMALAGESFKDPLWHAQLTGGSSSFRNRWDLIRSAGAAARMMLREAAASAWNIPPEQCTTKESRVLHPDGTSLGYGELVASAAQLPVPEKPALKKGEEYTIIGTSKPRFDIPDKVQGKTVYGMDFTLPDLCVAMIARSPRYGAKLESYDIETARQVRGVIKVIPLGNRIAVCAENTYAAMQGREALGAQWSAGSHPELNDAWIEAQLTNNLDEPGVEAKNSGDAGKAIAGAAQSLRQNYQLPYLSHAQVEPLNCTAHVERERCRIWVPTQGQTHTQKTAAHLTGLPEEKVEVMTLPAGGGFGLRGEQDEVIDAVLLSKALKRPVKVVCNREDEFLHGCFRPANHSRVEAGLNAKGHIVGWKHKVTTPSVMSRLMPHAVKDGLDPDAVSGLVDMVYPLANHRVEYVMAKLPIPVGWWRSVGYSTNTFVVESFMDELAHAAGKDPVSFRLEHMEKGGRAAEVLSLLAHKVGWGQPVPKGRFRGVAVAHCFESFTAHMAEVSVDGQGKPTVHKVVCALDCGTAIFPDAIKIQAEAGVIMALSTAFHEKMHFAQGGVATTNYSNYPLLSMSEVPEIEVHIAHNFLKAGGVGEPVFPSVAPAVANAIFSATGVRLRELPFRQELLVKG